MLVKGEGLTRLEAERRLVRLYKDEYARLTGRRGHVDALRSLVRTHKSRYNALLREVRDRPRSLAERETGSPSRAA